jgi:sigma-B regulation protein RsbU (phosphoserine phosphatase)
VISIVDLDRVIWISSHWSTATNTKSAMKEEARYESFCSWVIQDDTGRGMIIMDAKTDPRCTHMRVKSGLEFYAGAPLVTSDGIKIGSVSIRGPARTQFGIMDMNLLHEMAAWAMSEIEMLSQMRELELREIMQRARAKIGKLMENDNEIERGLGNSIIENVLLAL